MDFLKRFWEWIIAIVAIIGSIFIWAEVQRKKAIRASSRKKLEKLIDKNLNYMTRISNLDKAQKKLNTQILKERKRFEALEAEKAKILSKMRVVVSSKKDRQTKLGSLDESIRSLENRYANNSD